MNGDAPEGTPEGGLDGAAVPDEALTDVELTILRLERGWWKHAGAKETHIREELDMSATRYYQLLNALIDKPAALTIDPVTVNRLRRLRQERRDRR